MTLASKRNIWRQLAIGILFGSALMLLLPHASQAAVKNFVGIQSGVIARGLSITTTSQSGESRPWLSPGGGGCGASDSFQDENGFIYPSALPGGREYAPNIDGKWSDYVKHGYCKYPVAFGITIPFGNDLYAGYMWLYVGDDKIPAETDIRVCMQAKSGSKKGKAQCTPWASTLDSGKEWGTAPFAYDADGKDAETFRIKVESRKLIGRSVTDVRLRLRLVDYGGKEADWVTTKWSSKGGGWAAIEKIGKLAVYVPTGWGEYSDGAQIAMQVRLKNTPAPNLTASKVDLKAGGATQQGKTVQFTGTVHNGGDATTGKSFANRFEYRWGNSGSWTAIGNANASTLAAGKTSPTLTSPSLTLNQSGPLEVRLCADSGDDIKESNDSDNCSTTPVQFNIVALKPNLFITSLTRSPSSTLTEGQIVTFTGIVRNGENGSAAASTARFCLKNTNCLNSTSGRLGADQSVSVLGAQANSTSFTRTWTAVVGNNQTVTFCADTGKVVSETNEGDNCSGAGSSAKSLTFNVDPKPVANPVATLMVRNDTLNETAFKTPPQNKLAITAGQQLSLQWRGTNASSCSGTNFSTGGSIQGETASVNEPAAGAQKTFSVTCENTKGVKDTAQIQITAVAALPEITALKTTVLSGEPFTLRWNLNGNVPALCYIEGPGSEVATAGTITDEEGETEIRNAAAGTATYKLICPAGSDEVEIKVLPQVFES